MAIYSAGTSVVNATNVEAPRLTGAMPAIDGASLTGVSGSTAHVAVGTAHMVHAHHEDAMAPGGTRAGSDYFYKTSTDSEYNSWQSSAAFNNANSTSLSGTWRNMAHQGVEYRSGNGGVLLVVRTA